VQSLNNNTKAFFALVGAGLWERDVWLSPHGKINYDEVYRLAEEQSVVGLVAAGLEHVKDVKVPQEDALKFVGSALQLEQRNLAMNSFVASLIVSLRNNDIYTILLKGQGLSQCYERPLWRAAGDVDLFLSEHNYEKAKGYLSLLASSIDPEHQSNKHKGFTIDNWVVELHGSLRSSLSRRINSGLDSIQNDTFYGGDVRSWMNDGVLIFLLGVTNDVIYTFIHFLGHFYKGGLGLRQICDWCRLVWSYRDSLNLELLESRLRKMGLLSVWKAFSAFAVIYLGMPEETLPFYSSNKKWERKAKMICVFVLEVGNMGHNRDMSYSANKSYVHRKIAAFSRVSRDLIRHAKIFPLISLRFFSNFLLYGFGAFARGE
jgi:hypothetical protein